MSQSLCKAHLWKKKYVSRHRKLFVSLRNHDQIRSEIQTCSMGKSLQKRREAVCCVLYLRQSQCCSTWGAAARSVAVADLHYNYIFSTCVSGLIEVGKFPSAALSTFYVNVVVHSKRGKGQIPQRKISQALSIFRFHRILWAPQTRSVAGRKNNAIANDLMQFIKWTKMDDNPCQVEDNLPKMYLQPEISI